MSSNRATPGEVTIIENYQPSQSIEADNPPMEFKIIHDYRPNPTIQSADSAVSESPVSSTNEPLPTALKPRRLKLIEEATRLPSTLVRIIGNYATHRDFAANHYLVPAEIAAYCFDALRDTQQNGISCLLNGLKPEERVECIDLLSKDYPLLACYFKKFKRME